MLVSLHFRNLIKMCVVCFPSFFDHPTKNFFQKPEIETGRCKLFIYFGLPDKKLMTQQTFFELKCTFNR